jgi:hypothetical protein
MRTSGSTARFLIVGIILLCSAACSDNSYYSDLRSCIDSIPIINTHEHQQFPARQEGEEFNFYHIINTSYMMSDIMSAGAPEWDYDMVNEGNLDKLWNTYGKFIDYSRNTTFYSHLVEGFRILYGFEDPYFTKENIGELSEKIRINYSDEERWYDKAVKKAGYQTMLIDRYWDPFNTEINKNYFTLVFNINAIVYDAANKPLSTTLPEHMGMTYREALESGFEIKSINDYIEFFNALLDKFIDAGAVTLKNTLAYGRSLYFQDVPYERANELYQRNSSSLNNDERKELQDFMMHRIFEKAAEVDIPMQIHTGYLAGTGNTLQNSNPINLNNIFLKYRDARFVMFHGGFPWTGEFNALGKMFPNVYLDIVWLPQISRESAILAFDQMLDCVPYNKIFWGGDCHSIEESVGSLEFGKDVVATVLAKRIERGLMTEELAKEIAKGIFNENAVRFFRLKKVN